MTLEVQFDCTGWSEMISTMMSNCTIENLLKDAGEILNEDIASQFWEQGDPVWLPLSPRRMEERHRNGESDPAILIESGALLRSWSEPGGDHIEIIGSDSITVGSTLFYAELQQYGGANAEQSHVPPRPVRLREEAISQVAEQIIVHLTGE